MYTFDNGNYYETCDVERGQKLFSVYTHVRTRQRSWHARRILFSIVIMPVISALSSYLAHDAA